MKSSPSKTPSLSALGLNAQTAALALYLISSNVLLAYILRVKSGSYPPVAIFWVSITVILVALVAQIVALREGSRWRYLILGQIVGLTLALRLVFILPFPSVFGADPYQENNVANFISEHGWSFAEGASDPESTPYPVLHLLGDMTAEVSGTPLFDVTKWVPALYTLPVIPVLYLLVRSVYGSDKAGLLAALGIATLYQFVSFHSTFVREGPGLLLMLLAVYCYVKSLDPANNQIRLRTLAIFLASGVILSHHLSSFGMAVFFFLLAVISVTISQMHKLRLPILGAGASRPKAATATELSAVFATLVIVLAVGYWVHLKLSPLDILVRAIQDASQPAQFSPDFPGSLRNKIRAVGEGSFGAAFALLAILALAWRRDRITLTLLSFGAVMGLISLGLFNRVVESGSISTTFMAARFQLFAYLGLFSLAGYTVMRVIGRSPGLGICLSSLFVLFALLSVFRIPPYFYSGAQPNWREGEHRLYLADSERRALNWTTLMVGEARHVLTNFGLYVYFPAAAFEPADIDYVETLAPRRVDGIPPGVDLVLLSSPRSEGIEAGSQLRETALSGLNLLYDVGDVEILQPPEG